MLAAFLLLALLPRLWIASTVLRTGLEWDERINRANVAQLYTRGRLEPATYFYGGLSYIPQVLLLKAADGFHGLTGARWLEVWDAQQGLTRRGAFLCRLLQVLYGVASLWVTWLLGRRLFSPAAGWLAAGLLAVSPRHLHASATFKPDILLLLASLVAFYACCRVARRPSTGRFLAAGAGVGLAAAAKVNGASMAVPLVVVTAALPWSGVAAGWRRWLRLGLSGLAALAAFLVFNPDLAAHLRHLAENQAHYEAYATGDWWSVLAETVGYLFSPELHGPVVAALAVAGLLLVGWRLAAGRLRGAPALEQLALVSYPLSYYFVYLLLTHRAKPNHFLQVLPFTALLAACLLLAFWRWGATRLPATAGRSIAVALALGFAAWTTWAQGAYAYHRVLPRTSELAAARLDRALGEPPAARLVYYEPAAAPLAPRTHQLLATAQPVESLGELPPGVLDRADAEVFPRSALSGEHPQRYLERVARLPPGQVVTLESGWLEAWGPDLVVLLHPLALRGPAAGQRLALEQVGDGAWTGRLPAAPSPGDLLSLRLAVPLPFKEIGRLELQIDGRTLELIPVRSRRGESWFLTPRFAADGGGRPLRVSGKAAGAPLPQPRLRLYRWSP